MGFADTYLSKQQCCEFEMANADIIVVIPCFNEPKLEETLKSIAQCNNPKCQVGVIVVINASETATEEQLAQNRRSADTVSEMKQNLPPWMEFGFIEKNGIPKKIAGVGWARKTGMDAAISIFNRCDNSNGIIVSLDADCTVEKNYFEAIFTYFQNRPKIQAATINFEHPIDKLEKSEPIRTAIIFYELYMRYYRNALSFINFPHAIYTVGSCFAVRAIGYVKQGGMNRKQAGEDFYFLQKMTQLGKVENIDNTTVFPEIRTSDRVPFGTGPMLQVWLNGNLESMNTYPFALFLTLKEWFTHIKTMYSTGKSSSGDALFDTFLKQMDFDSKVNELRKNCGNFIIFESRFYQLFNAFSIIKWLNFALANGMEKEPLIDQSQELLKAKGYSSDAIPSTAEDLLILFRKIDNLNKD